MLKPSVALTKDLTISTYSLVVGIAKKAREISADAELHGEILENKPVDLAVQKYIAKDYEIVETEPCPVCNRLNCICEKPKMIPVVETEEPAEAEEAVPAEEVESEEAEQ